MPEAAGTIIACDVGERRIGLAVGESVTGSARPLAILDCRDRRPDWEGLARIIAEWRPIALVVGRPCHADGSDSRSTRLADRFARQAEGRFDLPVYRIDERLSSHEAAARRQAEGAPRRRRARPRALDADAAGVILETWFSERERP